MLVKTRVSSWFSREHRVVITGSSVRNFRTCKEGGGVSRNLDILTLENRTKTFLKVVELKCQSMDQDDKFSILQIINFIWLYKPQPKVVPT